MRGVLRAYTIGSPLMTMFSDLLTHHFFVDPHFLGVLMFKSSAMFMMSIALIAASVERLRAADPAPSNDIFPYPVTKTVLENGLTVLTVPYRRSGTACVLHYCRSDRLAQRN